MTIIGGEECFPVAATLSQFKSLIGANVPIPLSLLPLPTRWKIIFHQAIDFSRYPKKDAENFEKCKFIAASLRKIVQDSLDKETVDRPLARFSRFAKHFMI